MDSAPVSPQRVYSLSREASEWVQGPSDHGQGPRQLLWEPKPLVEQISGTWARAQPVSESDGESGGSRLQLSPSHKPDDIRQETKLQTLFRGLPKWYFQWLGIHMQVQGTQVRSLAAW